MGRRTEFAKGFLVGLLGLPVLLVAASVALLVVAGTVLLIIEGSQPAGALDARPAFATRGADLTSGGAASVRVRLTDAEAQQTCRGPCDDLAFWGRSLKRVEVRGPGGRLLLDERPPMHVPFVVDETRPELGGSPLDLRSVR